MAGYEPRVVIKISDSASVLNNKLGRLLLDSRAFVVQHAVRRSKREFTAWLFIIAVYNAMVPLPLVKLVGLAVKQFISKPVASFMKTQMKTKPFLRNRICIPMGRSYHNFQVSMTQSKKSQAGFIHRFPGLVLIFFWLIWQVCWSGHTSYA